VRFWDSSAIIPLLVREAASDSIHRLLSEDHDMLVWWGTPVECTSAIARRERDEQMDPEAAVLALERLRVLVPSWMEIQPSERVRSTAQRALRVHALRAADALQLAAAIVAAGEDRATLQVVCLDQRLALAAQREGFQVAL
jgi:predicted nucleic acid-binding protein